MRRNLYIYVLVALLALSNMGASGQRLSPIAQGHWAKISIGESGLHRLSKSDLKSLGFEHPERVRLWGYGGTLLSEQIVLLRGHGLQEVPTLLEGDHLYFYGEGVTSWHYLPSSQFFTHRTNHYTTRGYYLLSEGEQPLRMEVDPAQEVQPSGAEAQEGISFVLGEEDLYSPSKSGRKLYGQSMQTRPRLSFSHSLPEAVGLRLRFAFMAFPSGQDATLRALIAGTEVARASITLTEMQSVVSSGTYKVYGTEKEHIAPGEIPVSGSAIGVDFELSGTGYPAHLDYYELNVRQRLRLPARGQLRFSRLLSQRMPNQMQAYQLEGVQGAMLLRLERNGRATLVKQGIATDAIGLELKATDEAGVPVQHLVCSLDAAQSPQLHGRIPNQNLLGSSKPADLLIITTAALRAEATRLANHYQGQGYRVELATQEEVFNEFNGGTPDATAYRLWVRYHYDLHQQQYPGEDSPLQLLLIGDAAHDNRKLTQDWQTPFLKNTELLLSYQSVSSLDLSSYTSDDYFGVLRDETSRGSDREGYPIFPELKDLPMDIGVGRLPVRTPQEARQVIDKIIRYETQLQSGAWKMRTVFLADNGDGNSHTRQSLEISNRLEAQVPALELTKIYMAAYPRESVGGQTAVPGAHRAFLEALNEGVLIANYNGHGGPKSWADEQVLTINDIQNFSFSHLPLWITATCDFGGFDDPTTSAGEEILLHPTSGGIALLSTTRVVWDIPNQMLNMAILKELFTPDRDGRYRPLGLVVRDAKNSLRTRSTPENRLNFVLLGSPLLRLPLPPNRVHVSSLSGQSPTDREAIRLHALERIPIEGYIQTPMGDIDGDFSGHISLTIYDGEEELETIDNFSRYDAHVRPVRYRAYRNVIYTGYADVDGGRFATYFDIPKDVAYSGRNGRISLYALDPKSGREVVGLSANFIITPGSSDRISEDNEGPSIHSIKLSGRDALSLPRVASETLLEVELSDKSAINLSTAGIGHRVRLTIDGNTEHTHDLSRYYTPLPSPSGAGIIRYLLKGLSVGQHTARFEVWDIHNNATQTDFSFVVEERITPHIQQIELHPSPVARGQNISLVVTHDLPGSNLTARLAIYDLSGRLLWERKPIRLIAAESSSYRLHVPSSDLPQLALWPSGTYLLRLSLSAHSDSETSTGIKFIVK